MEVNMGNGQEIRKGFTRLKKNEFLRQKSGDRNRSKRERIVGVNGDSSEIGDRDIGIDRS